MNRATRLALLLSLVAIFAVAFTPLTSSRNKSKPEGDTSGSSSKSQKANPSSVAGRSVNSILASNGNLPVPEPTVEPFPEPADGDEEDPDLPPGMAGKIDKEAYLRARGDYIGMMRGRDSEDADEAREKALRQLDKQEKQMKKSLTSLSTLVNTTDWVF